MSYDPEIHHRKSIRLRGYDYSVPGRYFVTICALEKACLFGGIADGQSAGKMGVVGLTKTMAKEWGRFNINVNAVAYGFIETRLTAAKEKQQPVQVGENEIQLGIPDQMRQMAVNFIPLGRAGTPEEAAGPVLFLASPLSDYVTGHVLLVTGGSYL
jgi:3-oxoacyl-[acyl-carrier protein] reductase